MRRFLPFAALIGVALVLGCQDVGSGPVGPDGLVPQFDKGGTPGAVAECPGGVDRDDKGHCHGDEDDGGGDGPKVKGQGTLVDVAVTGGMIATNQLMELWRKRDQVSFRAGALQVTKEPYFSLKMDMIYTDAAGRQGGVADGAIIVDALGNVGKSSGGTLCDRTGPRPPDEEVRKLFGKLVQNAAALRDVLVKIDTTAVGGWHADLGDSSEDHVLFISGGTIRVVGPPKVEWLSGDLDQKTFKVEFSGKIQLASMTEFAEGFHLICEIQSGDEITFEVTEIF